jgi:hypothetical protein
MGELEINDCEPREDTCGAGRIPLYLKADGYLVALLAEDDAAFN